MGARPPVAPEPMRRRVLAVFAVSALFYVVFYYGLEWWRGRRGPWEATYLGDAAGAPALVVRHSRLGLGPVTLRFPGAKRSETKVRTVQFDRPRVGPLPFGELKFIDPTFLPGTVTLNVFGHDVELLPRVLRVDGQEHRWTGGTTLDLPAREPPPASPPPQS